MPSEAADSLLERAIALQEANPAAVNPLSLLTRIALDEGHKFADWSAHGHALALILRQLPRGTTVTHWWEGKHRSTEEVLKLLRDALWEAQTGD